MIDQYERVLGKITEGWSDKTSPETLRIQVVRTVHSGDGSVFLYSTLGLSTTPLKRSASTTDYYIEFSICLTSDSNSQWAPGVLLELANKIARRGVVPIRGDIIESASFNIGGMLINGFYVTTPLFLNENARSFVVEGKEVSVVWLVPLTAEEITFSNELGWQSFEDYLENFLEQLIHLPRAGMVI